MHTHHTLRATATVLFAATLLAGCGGGGTGSGSTSESATGGAATSESSSGSASGSSSAPAMEQETISTRTTDLGTFLVDEDGKTLYLFTKDSPGKSVCEGDCLAAWPAVTGPAKAGSGVDASLLGTTQRSDGSTQATYNKWPLYYYAPDKNPGDVTGQGVNDVWWVVSPQGEAIMGKAPATSSSGSSSSGY